MKDNITYSKSELFLRSAITDSQKSIIYVKAYDNNRVLDVLKSLGTNGWIWKESTGQIFNLKTGNVITVVVGYDDKPVKCELRTNKLSGSIKNLLNYNLIKILVAQISNKTLKDDGELLPRLDELIKRNQNISNKEKQVVILLSNGVEVDPCLESICEKVNVSISGKDKIAQYGIKPIRTRFVSESIECTTLFQLRSNFFPNAIYETYSQLLKWLDQNHENEIRELLVTNEDKICKDKNQTSLFLLYKIFFHDMFEERGIKDLTSLCWNWYSNSEKDTKNYKYLCKEIRERQWGNQFFLNISGEYVQSQDKNHMNSQDDIFRIYRSFCEGCVFFKGIKNLSELYAYLAKSIDYLREFEVLDEEIRRHDWGNDFFMRIIPEFYILSNDYAIVKKGNLKLPIDNRVGLFSLYDYFLHDLFEDKGIDNLLGLYIYLLFDTESDNSRNLHNEISKQLWCVSFFSELIKELTRFCHENDSNNHYNINQFGLNDESVDGMYSIYHFFLGNFLEDNNIDDIEELYSYWSNSNSECFANLHDEIINTQWGESFLNNIVKRLLIEFNSESKKMTDIDEKNLLSFYNKYFGFYLSSHKIKNISDLYVGLSKDNNYKKCFECLEEVLYNNMWGIEKTLSIYRTYNNLFSKERWLLILQKLYVFLDKYHDKYKWSMNKGMDDKYKKYLYQIAKLYIEDFGKLRDGYDWLIKLEDMIYPDAITYLKEQRNKEKSINKEFRNLYEQYDKMKWEKDSEGDLSITTDKELESKAKTLHENWILKTQSLIHKVVKAKGRVDKIESLVDFMRALKQKGDVPYGYGLDSTEKGFFEAFTYTNTLSMKMDSERLYKIAKLKSSSYFEIQFVYSLLGIYNGGEQKKAGMKILKSMESQYPPASNILNSQPFYIDGIDLRQLLDGSTNEDMFNHMLMAYCKYMVYYAMKKK